MTTFRRAMREAQKQERRQAILEVALEIFEHTQYREITLDMVAERVGLARGTLYLYFKTREELFLAVLEMLLEPWFAGVDERLSLVETRSDVSSVILQVTAIFTDALTQNMAVTRLMALLPIILEYNIDLERARAFKEILLAYSRRTGALLERMLPFLRSGRSLSLLVNLQTLLVGIVQQAEPAPVIQQLLSEPGMEPFRVQFRPTFSRLFRALLFDLEREEQ